MSDIQMHIVPNSYGKNKEQYLRIDRKKGRITSFLQAWRFKDSDTHQWVFYIAALDASGYGETLEKAYDSVMDVAMSMFDYIMSLSEDETNRFLSDFGFVKSKLFNKRYSTVSVDINGRLEGFNIEEGTLQSVALETA